MVTWKEEEEEEEEEIESIKPLHTEQLLSPWPLPFGGHASLRLLNRSLIKFTYKLTV